MPELPEVEKVRRDLEAAWPGTSTIVRLQFFRKDLRYPLPSVAKRRALEGLGPVQFGRRGKFLVWDFPGLHIVSHLGMSGSWRWRVEGEKERKAHDHIQITLSDGRDLIYHDPRRFGSFEILTSQELRVQKTLNAMGPDPLFTKLSAQEFQQRYQKSQRAIKVLLMDQKVMAGVGNIYACEVLFLARVHPEKAAAQVSLKEWQKILKALPPLLERSVAAGGTTLKDFVHASGEKGGFQLRLAVYGQGGRTCRQCKGEISSKVLGGRATYWCAVCQKR